ncbi:MAG: 2-oxoacid:acceptor oxidoreductase family protein, partial [Campylobacterales bacterium]
AIPNTPMLGAFVKVSDMLELDYFQNAMRKVLGKKLPEKIIQGNMAAIEKAYKEVH